MTECPGGRTRDDFVNELLARYFSDHPADFEQLVTRPDERRLVYEECFRRAVGTDGHLAGEDDDATPPSCTGTQGGQWRSTPERPVAAAPHTYCS
jgi:hypothetical protein